MSLEAEAAAHVVVTVDNLIIVALAASEGYSVNEDTLLDAAQVTHVVETVDDAGTERHGF